jgi:lipopolysaccharide/colanic/teichoic acid biosynthesis glycosyltransferase
MWTSDLLRTPALASGRGTRKSNGGQYPSNGSFEGEGVAITPQHEFQRILRLERRRTDRSDTPFLLMLLGVVTALRNGHASDLVRRLTEAVTSSVRETDAWGWYEDQALLGVIFTEIDSSRRQLLADLIRTKVEAALHRYLRPEELSQISIAIYQYPEPKGKSGLGRPVNLQMYPDLAEVYAGRKVGQVLKRAIDLVGSGVALILLSPLFGVLALLIRITSKGPILFRQKRVGQCGRAFTFLKFRTMHAGTDASIHKDYIARFIAGDSDSALGNAEEQEAVYKLRDDPRVTPVGKFLRKSSLDELPQLWNVLRGEMSLVGPRPPIPYEVERYAPWHLRRVLEVKPGITGLWQVSGRSKTKFNDMVRLDLQYARAWSLWLDLKILFQTPGAVWSGDGAY